MNGRPGASNPTAATTTTPHQHSRPKRIDLLCDEIDSYIEPSLDISSLYDSVTPIRQTQTTATTTTTTTTATHQWFQPVTKPDTDESDDANDDNDDYVSRAPPSRGGKQQQQNIQQASTKKRKQPAKPTSRSKLKSASNSNSNINSRSNSKVTYIDDDGDDNKVNDVLMVESDDDGDFIAQKTMRTISSTEPNMPLYQSKSSYFNIDKTITKLNDSNDKLTDILNRKRAMTSNNNNSNEPSKFNQLLQQLRSSSSSASAPLAPTPAPPNGPPMSRSNQLYSRFSLDTVPVAPVNKPPPKTSKQQTSVSPMKKPQPQQQDHQDQQKRISTSMAPPITPFHSATPQQQQHQSPKPSQTLSDDDDFEFSPFAMSSMPLIDSPFKPKGLYEQMEPSTLSQASQLSFDFSLPTQSRASQPSNNLLGALQQHANVPITTTTLSRTPSSTKRYERLIAIEVNYQVFPGETKQSNPIHKKTVRCYSEELATERVVWLFGEWCYTPINSGDVLNVIGEYDMEHGAFVVDNNKNLIVLHPDLLITGTELGGSFTCSRRALLKEQMSSEFNSTVPLYGSIVHEVFQRCLSEIHFEKEYISSYKRDVLLQPNYALKLSSLGETHDEASNHIELWQSTIQNFGNTFIDSQNSKKNIIEIENQKWHMQITKVLDIEENIWSLMYGLKGKIDSSVEIKLRKPFESPSKRKKQSPSKGKRQSKTTTNTDDSVKYLNVPFEIKTGKPFEVPFISHTSQVLIYILMMNDRYNQDINLGLLYYLKNSKEKVGKNYGLIHPVLPTRNQIRSLIVARNILVHYINQNNRMVLNPNPILPKMLKEPHICAKCYLIDQCLLHHKSVENGDRHTSGLGDLFDSKTSHLKPSHLEYLKKWNKLISLELESNNNYRKLIWNYPSKFREDKGLCIGAMTLEKEKTLPEGGVLYKFSVQDKDKITNSLFFKGDYVTISIEDKYYGVSAGQVTDIASHSIKVICREKITEPPTVIEDAPTIVNDDFGVNGLCSVALRSNPKVKPMIQIEYEDDDVKSQEMRRRNRKQRSQASQQLPHVSPTRNIMNRSRKNFELYGNEQQQKYMFRIDKDEGSTSGYLMLKTSLFNMFMSKANERLRDLVVDLVPPQFDPLHTVSTDISKHMKQLNNDQQKAIQSVLSARDYALILGMPGTGKSLTIANLVNILSRLGKSVLVTSYTHTSLDALLEKCVEVGVGKFLRLASNINQVGASIQKYCLESQQFESITSMKTFLDAQRIVATTCLGVNHAYFNISRMFDYCIIDEASQLTQPTCFGALKYCKTFVLVGDHFQLPPLVQNSEAKRLGMEESLFKRLSCAFPNAVSYLYYQYRMCNDIMMLSNELIYNGRLRCGGTQQANWMLPVRIDPQLYPPSSWVHRACKSDVRVLFINTDSIEQSKEQRFGDLYANSIEAVGVATVVECLLNSGCTQNDIGVISPNRIQLRYIKQAISELFQKHSLSSRHGTQALPYSDIDILTIDKYQGKDKDCIIISMVRNNDQSSIGDLLKDWRRLNVSFTRARKKLLIFGSLSTLSTFPLYADLQQILTKQGWILNLSSNDIMLPNNNNNTGVSSTKPSTK
ncbi:hypothetical protein SAMD00019534_008030 [Acytostelium subglobosum LB1]|uniref:hypothetical protein n=1 Tax=Acytostelium subglobosum LB1 TaxID=1410327 RepID=UPI0006451F14|nr:hypothetical protein SAMD00019534_008030 [Acytostelium subglobosum LB1]GAM17628.1 hypothetical protein SAMD00019534_008030 [Acytostelium subglobosum LB1]|eukprot:XP_012758224.1 hypothetical protein SAMD00019534_008030 [Acytostelium subglobosum LB1]